MQSVGFDFFFAGEPDESVEAVEVEAFEVDTAAKKDGILDCPFAMSAFDELERGHNFGGSSLLAKSSSSSFDLLRSSSSSSLTDMLSVCAGSKRGENKRSFKIENRKIFWITQKLLTMDCFIRQSPEDLSIPNVPEGYSFLVRTEGDATFARELLRANNIILRFVNLEVSQS
jgi:hypothetical protein